MNPILVIWLSQHLLHTYGTKVNAILFSIKDKNAGYKFNLITQEDLNKLKNEEAEEYEGYVETFRHFEISLFGKTTRLIPDRQSGELKAKTRGDCHYEQVEKCYSLSQPFTDGKKTKVTTRSSCLASDGTQGESYTVTVLICDSGGTGDTSTDTGGIFGELGGSNTGTFDDIEDDFDRGLDEEIWGDEGAGGTGDINDNLLRNLKLAELQQRIQEDPLFFIENCISDEIEDWQDLLTFVPGDLVESHLNNRGDGDWEIQNIRDASGAVLNIDYFGTTFDQFPEINGTPMTPDQFFEYVHSNFFNFDDGCNSSFDFLDTNIDGSLWNSNNPLGSIININIFGPDNGSVIVSQFDDAGCYCWTFTTITESQENGEHPVSGNRQFGITQNSDGSWTFFTRGVDRAIDNNLGISSGVGFRMADSLWNCIINNMRNFINSNGGNTVNTFSKTIRPDWNSIEDYLNSLGTIDIIKCLDLYEER